MSLMDQIKQNMQGQQAPTARPDAATANPLQQLQALSRAKTGKAVQDTGPQASSLMQQVQAQTAQDQSRQLGQQGQQQALNFAQAEAAQEQEVAQKKELLSEQLIDAQADFNRRAADLYQDFARKGEQLDFQKDKAKAEQLGFSLRLSNDQYINRLQNQAAKARLDNAVNFREELTRAIFAEEQDLFEDSLEFRRLMNADDRAFMDRMAEFDLSMALDLAKSQNEAAANSMIWQGAGTVASAGARAYANYDPNAPKAGDESFGYGDDDEWDFDW